MEAYCQMYCFTIEFERDTGTNKNLAKFYDLYGTYYNYDQLLTWSKKLGLLSCKEISDIETFENKKLKFQILHEKIQKNIKITYTQQTKTIIENILKNLILSDQYNLTQYTEELHAEEHLEIHEIKTTCKLCETTSALPVYPMRTKNRGVLFFVNIRNFPQYSHSKSKRSGSESDKFYLISLFQKFGYKIYYYEDLLLSVFWKLVNQLIEFHLNDAESLLFVVASHGNENHEIEFYLGEKTNIFDILYKFGDHNCPKMEGKPKIFLFPCCRGEKQDYGVKRYGLVETDGLKTIQPIYSDILICYATIHGFVTNRDINFGSWYIESFYRVLAQKAYESDIESMLYVVNETVKHICNQCMEINKKRNPEHRVQFQTPYCVRRDFNKLLFFNPGYVDEG